ncbi:hypothetical protein FM042_07130 [Aliidiomarina halalkaliphila]|uniref:Uncharacterized protein n=1 Tax=Aliidiomarina halalkaliphila TaxID=2593535 RepID=A0A552X128_9GAMM|nr:hypothetical protein [Aliidiomarina halalkaliphila]TRW48750.1 hypothetical protein FM042_07130 [Aliidiomarina halalkaliphila]
MSFVPLTVTGELLFLLFGHDNEKYESNHNERMVIPDPTILCEIVISFHLKPDSPLYGIKGVEASVLTPEKLTYPQAFFRDPI